MSSNEENTPSALLPEGFMIAATPPPQMGASPVPGTVIEDKYRVVRELGRGSVGRVLLARDILLERDVAIKQFLSPLLASEETRERFLVEAQTMAKVRHINVVSIHAFGGSDVGPYFVMEYIDGPSLEEWLEGRGILPVDEALAILTQVCLGVDAIHAVGAVHHDLKPGNILVGPDNRIAVTDLGLARVVSKRGPNAKVTAAFAGTPWYMAPEQVVRTKVDPAHANRIDIYALGVLAFELLTGSPPFRGKSMLEVLQQHVRKPPPRPSEDRRTLSPAFDEPILKALAKNPEDRPPTAKRFIETLKSAREQTQSPLEPRRILVADDDIVFLEFARTVLEEGFPNAKVQCVDEGAAALTVLEDEPVDVAVLDLDMPKLNAIELTAYIQPDVVEKRTHIVVVTAAGGAAEWKVLAQLHADAFLLKPIEPNLLVQTLRQVVGG